MDMTWRELQCLAEHGGDSFYVLDLARFAENYRNLLGEFRAIYTRTSIAYSYKTNYTPALCQWSNAAGGYAEVVSGMEYEHALRNGVSAERIIFNGPYKTNEELRTALAGGSLVNIDNEWESDRVSGMAKARPKERIRLGLRCNIRLSDTWVSRFGLNSEKGALLETLQRLRNCGAAVEALHCHISTPDRSAESFQLRTRRMLELCRECFGGEGPSMLNIGGGFFSPMSVAMQKQFGVNAPSFREYAEAVAGEVAQVYGGTGNGPELVVEPGSALVSDAMTFVTRVLDIKRNGLRNVALTAGSIHTIKPTLHRKNMLVKVVRGPTPARLTGEPVDIVGYTCMEHDCLHAGYRGEMAEGDFCSFENVGAYTTVMKPPFIQPAPAIFVSREDRSGFDVARRRETHADIFRSYNFSQVPMENRPQL